MRCFFHAVSAACLLILTSAVPVRAQEPAFGTFTLPDMLPPPVAPPPSDQPLRAQPLPDLPSAPALDEAALRRQFNPPDPIIANLTPVDRGRVMALVDLVNDFAAEIRNRERRFAEEWFDGGRQELLLEEMFAAENARRRFRFVALDNLPTADNLDVVDNPTVNRFNSAFDAPRSADHLNRKQEYVTLQRGQIVGRKNCVPAASNEFLDREDFLCFEHEPHDWILSNYFIKDWFKDADPVATNLLEVSETVDGEAVVSQGALSDFLNLRFYDRHGRIIEALSRNIGRNEQSTSIFIGGVPVDDDPNKTTAGAELNGDGEYRLHSAMREALASMHNYVTRARQSWRTYERAIARELPPLYARALARPISHAQRVGVLQEPLYAQLLAIYNETPHVNEFPAGSAINEARQKARAQYAGFVNGAAGSLAEIDRLRECIYEARPKLRPTPLDWPVFHDPLFHVIEAIPDIESGTYLLGHQKGQTAGLEVAPSANGVGHMPAGGGFVLEECGLEREATDDSGDAQVAEAQTMQLRAFGAANEARP